MIGFQDFGEVFCVSNLALEQSASFAWVRLYSFHGFVVRLGRSLFECVPVLQFAAADVRAIAGFFASKFPAHRSAHCR